jgi:hypothetical protein
VLGTAAVAQGGLAQGGVVQGTAAVAQGGLPDKAGPFGGGGGGGAGAGAAVFVQPQQAQQAQQVQQAQQAQQPMAIAGMPTAGIAQPQNLVMAKLYQVPFLLL